MILHGIGPALRTMWRLATPYFRSEERLSARLLLAAIIGMELGIVGIMVLLNQWNADFYNALQDRNWPVFVAQLWYFSTLAAIFLVGAVLQYYLNQWLQIRWRRWMTEQYLAAWLDGGTHYRQKMTGDAADNPDQRIAEDIKLFINHTLSIGIDLLSSVVTLVSFVVILWGLSAAAPLVIGGETIAIPGYLVWAALIYAIFGTIITHLLGRRLIPLNFQQERYEANFRFALMRLRENSEQVALQRGERAEHGPLRARFANVIRNFMALVDVQKNVVMFRAGYNQAATVFPFIVVSPAYFAGAIQLGPLMQTASAFDRVQTALSVFITIYTRIAEWKAVVDRLSGFDAAIVAAQESEFRSPHIEVIPSDGDTLDIENLTVELPSGHPVVAVDKLSLRPGERRILSGPSGTGKTTLFRGLSGVWPWGRGVVRVPRDTRLLVLPQKPYMPLVTLRAALTYPAPPDAISDAAVRGAVNAVGLASFADRLDNNEDWAAILSGGEQQRVQLARALLQAPDWLLLDEATSALDPESERRVLDAVTAALPGTAILAITHRSPAKPFDEPPLQVRAPTTAAPALVAV